MSLPPDIDEDDEPGFFQRFRFLIFLVVALLVLGGIGLSVYLLAGKPAKPRPPAEIAIHLMPPPEQKMVEQPPVKPDEVKPKNEPKAPDKPPGPPGPPATGPASDFGLGGGGGGGGNGFGDGGGGSKYGYYANEVGTRIKAAIHENDKTRDASAHVKVRLWVDSSGRITRAKLAKSSDDPSVDAAIQNEVLNGLTLPEPPPADMPMPIVLLLSEVRPN
jgi:protein TonB